MVDVRQRNRGVLARGLAVLGGIVLLLAFAPALAAQPKVLNQTLTSDGNSQTIQVNADQISTWTEAGQEILLLQGNVVVSQGANTIRATDGVLWVDMPRYEKERVLHVIVYGQNPINVDSSRKSDKADFGYVRLTTTDKLNFKSFKGKVAQQDMTNHPVYLKAVVSRPDGIDLPIRKTAVVDPGLRQAAMQPVAMPLPPPAPMVNVPDAPAPKQTTTYLQVPPGPTVTPLGGGPADGPVTPPGPPPVFPSTPNAQAPTPTGPPAKPPQRISVRPRYDGTYQASSEQLGPNLSAQILSGGLAILITIPSDKPGGKDTTFDMEADRVVIWKHGGQTQFVSNTRDTQTVEGDSYEIYLAGHVELFSRTLREREIVRADEVYYDVKRGVAVARKALLEIQSEKLSRPLFIRTPQLLQVNPKVYKMETASLFSSLLPSDPGLRFDVDNLTIEEFQKERSYLYGAFPAYDSDGKRIVDTQRFFTGQNMVARLEDVPVFYFPYMHGNVERPLGPLDSANIGYNTIYGMTFSTTWDMFDLLNLYKPDGSRWKLNLDYLSLRGPGFGTEYDFEGKDLFGVKSKYSGMIQLYGTFDHGIDVLGGDRGEFIYWPNTSTANPISAPDFRGWAHGQINVQDLPDGFTVLGKFAFLSDRNYLEEYYPSDFLNGMNQDTYLYVKQQQNNWAWSLEGQIGTQDWMTHTNWLPKVDGALLGQTFFDDWLVYNGQGSAGYGQLRPALPVPYAYFPTDVRANTGRLDARQDVSMPLDAGPLKIVPYVDLDTAYYSEDVNGQGRGRLVGGAGVRWNLPLSRIYPDVQSDLLNLNEIYHKINLRGNFYYAQSTSGVNNFPQFDRLNDDASDQALRDIRPWQSLFNPANATFLTTSNLFNPQNYAIRRLLDVGVDTIDSIDVVQLGIDQRWQTKRGFPGSEHVVDWMTLNVDVSIFPEANRDNYGKTFGILEYDWVWNIGDRTALTSSGWFEPWSGGPRYFEFGAYVNRTDTTAFYFGYRQIDPIESKVVIASVIFPLSAKYAMTASTVWDFGNHVSSYSLFLSRMGTDVMVNFGLTYNSTINTFGVAFEILPNLAARQGMAAALFPRPLLNIDPMVNTK